jgi:hypothetical protein
MPSRRSSNREAIHPGTDNRYVRQRERRQFKEPDGVRRPVTADATTEANRGHRDRGGN